MHSGQSCRICRSASAEPDAGTNQYAVRKHKQTSSALKSLESRRAETAAARPEELPIARRTRAARLVPVMSPHGSRARVPRMRARDIRAPRIRARTWRPRAADRSARAQEEPPRRRGGILSAAISPRQVRGGGGSESPRYRASKAPPLGHFSAVSAVGWFRACWSDRRLGEERIWY